MTHDSKEMTEPFSNIDDLGPEKVIQIYDPQTQLKAILVVDNVALGPSIGGIRMAPDVTVEECTRLARAMTLKNAAAGIPHGGGKSVIFGDPHMAKADKEILIRSFAHAIDQIVDYIPGPDMGTDEEAMAWIKEVIGRVVGLPRDIGGIPLDEIGATGFGLSVAIEVAQDFCDVRIEGARVAVQGFGSVGQHVARFLGAKGARLVAASDSRGCCFNPAGIDVAALIEFKQAGNPVADYAAAETLQRDALLDIECDIWIPAARPDVLTADNVDRLKARVVAEGANIPATEEAERLLAERNVLVLPDFVCNAGGVICGAMELKNATESEAMQVIEEKIRDNMREVLATAHQEGKLPRQAATDMARARVLKAMSSLRK
jgi:glutamate dehydrogenase/leucine dehydrogenase